MRLTELKSIPAEDVLAYVQSRHENFNIPKTITDHPTWRQTRVPLSQLHIPDDESGEVKTILIIVYKSLTQIMWMILLVKT